jgi:hypothetical protein
MGDDGCPVSGEEVHGPPEVVTGRIDHHPEGDGIEAGLLGGGDQATQTGRPEQGRAVAGGWAIGYCRVKRTVQEAPAMAVSSTARSVASGETGGVDVVVEVPDARRARDGQEGGGVVEQPGQGHLLGAHAVRLGHRG